MNDAFAGVRDFTPPTLSNSFVNAGIFFRPDNLTENVISARPARKWQVSHSMPDLNFITRLRCI